MHQIRVHLQFLGFPIANDPLYNSQIFGPEKGKGGDIGKTHQQLIEDLVKNHTVENWVESEEYETSKMVASKMVRTERSEVIAEIPTTEEEREVSKLVRTESNE